MECQRCKSDRVLIISGKCSDQCFAEFKGEEGNGYAPEVPNIAEDGDYVCPKVCLECGQVQGKFPVKDPNLKEM